MFILDAGEHHDLGYGYADLYTEDGTFGTRPPGREALAAAAGRAADGSYSEVHQRGSQNQINMSVSEIIVPTEDGAKGTSYLLMIDGPGEPDLLGRLVRRRVRQNAERLAVQVARGRGGEPSRHPSNAAAIRREWQKLAMQHLTGDDAIATGAQPIARDPLNWVDSPE